MFFDVCLAPAELWTLVLLLLRLSARRLKLSDQQHNREIDTAII